MESIFISATILGSKQKSLRFRVIRRPVLKNFNLGKAESRSAIESKE